VELKCTVDKTTISEADALNLPYNERARLIQKDPITCALHFERRFQALRKTWSSEDGPFHEYSITHHYHRIEFQQRG
jgi:hypothetical protein